MPGVSTAITGSVRRIGGRWACCSKRPAETAGISRHFPYFDLAEQFREHLQHRLPVLQHVGDAGGRAGIVFQHEEVILTGAYNVRADNVGINAAGGRYADHFRQESIIVSDQLGWNTARP